MQDIKELALTIKKLRELKEITREVMADKLDLSLSGYAKIERGESEISVTKLFKIAEVLGVGINELLHFDVSKVFNITHNQMVQGAGAENVHLHNHLSEHLDNYIKLLVLENKELKATIEALKAGSQKSGKKHE